jgi:hypothetical protein
MLANARTNHGASAAITNAIAQRGKTLGRIKSVIY